MGIDPIIVKSVAHNVAKDEGCKTIECFFNRVFKNFFSKLFLAQVRTVEITSFLVRFSWILT